jgi:hypothetical protein
MNKVYFDKVGKGVATMTIEKKDGKRVVTTTYTVTAEDVTEGRLFRLAKKGASEEDAYHVLTAPSPSGDECSCADFIFRAANLPGGCKHIKAIRCLMTGGTIRPPAAG